MPSEKEQEQELILGNEEVRKTKKMTNIEDGSRGLSTQKDILTRKEMVRKQNVCRKQHFHQKYPTAAPV